MPDLPGASGVAATDRRLQYDINQTIWVLEIIDDVECKGWHIVHIEFVEPPEVPGQSPWTEKWRLDRCGELVGYEIGLQPTPEPGDTDFSIKIVGDEGRQGCTGCVEDAVMTASREYQASRCPLPVRLLSIRRNRTSCSWPACS